MAREVRMVEREEQREEIAKQFTAKVRDRLTIEHEDRSQMK